MKPSRNICRCCLSQDCYRDVFEEHYWSGHKEVYSEMLQETLNITISQQQLIKKSCICELCIVKLREITAFKKQVLNAEKMLTQKQLSDYQLNEMMPKLGTDYKDDFDDHISVDFEEDSPDDRLSLDFDDHISFRSDNDSDWGFDETISKKNDEGQLLVIKLDNKKKIERQKSPIIEAKEHTRSNIQGDNTNYDSSNPMDNNDEKSPVSKGDEKDYNDENEKSPVPECDQKINSKKVINNSKGKKAKKIAKGGVNTKKKRKVMLQSEKDIRDNTIKLILNSNLCLFESLKTKYRCFSCKETYLSIAELKNHSKVHDNVKDMHKRIYRLRGLSYKFAEISNLMCKLCDRDCTDLKDLKEHLIESHKIKFGDADHFLIPYRIENEFDCVICQQKFNTFLRLSMHMNTHYTNNVCEICGSSYINRLSLRMHVSSVHREKKCSLCPATFLSQNLRVKHMRKCHHTGHYKRYCLLCDKTFPYTYQLLEHKIQEHGVERKVTNCAECGKVFLTMQNLKIHIRSVHIRERNYNCSVCDMRFFTKCDQIRHETTHDLSKSFGCSMCDVKFKTKDSVRRHLRKQHGLL